MTLMGRLAIPSLLAGLLAIAASGIVPHPAFAAGTGIGAGPGPVVEADPVMRLWPASYMRPLGVLALDDGFEIERCITPAFAAGWCLVRQDSLAGWVDARHLPDRR